MEDRTPDTPDSTLVPEEGRRPEADPSVARPDQEEPNGPVEGLLHATATEVAAKVSDDPAVEAEAEALGVEDEGIESGQIMGLVIATMFSIAVVVLTIVFLFYLPTLNQTEVEMANVPGERYEELRENRAEGLGLISAYATDANDPTVFRIPIEEAMEQVARQAGSADEGNGLVSRTDYNLSWIDVNPVPAARAADASAGPLGGPVMTLGVSDSLAVPAPVAEEIVEETSEVVPSEEE